MLLPLHKHRHDHVNVVIRAYRADDAGAGWIEGFQGHLGLVENTEDVGEVLAVEGDLGRLAIDDSVDFTQVVAQLLSPGRDANPSWR